MTWNGVHLAAYRGVWHPVDVACRCGWVSVGHRSRGEAARAHEAHKWLVSRSATGYVVEIDEEPPRYREPR